MEVIKTAIDGVLILQPRVFRDERGYFFESFSQREFEEKVGKINFVQDNESMSSYGVMRGLHYQRMPHTQSKLVRCVRGAVLDVAVDIRWGSPTFGQHVSCLLCGHDEEGRAIAAKHKDLLNHLPQDHLPLLLPTGKMSETGEGLEGLLGLQFFVPRGFAHGFAVLSQTAVFQYKCDNFYHPASDAGINIKDESLHIDWRIPVQEAILSAKDLKHDNLIDCPHDFKIEDELY